jgi:hypothetical protein
MGTIEAVLNVVEPHDSLAKESDDPKAAAQIAVGM